MEGMCEPKLNQRYPLDLVFLLITLAKTKNLWNCTQEIRKNPELIWWL
jgi:hypothetical protein